MAETLRAGLVGLGHRATVTYCAIIGQCEGIGGKGGGAPQVIVLAPHNLAHFVDAEGRPAVLSHPEVRYIPPDAVLYVKGGG